MRGADTSCSGINYMAVLPTGGSYPYDPGTKDGRPQSGTGDRNLKRASRGL